MKFQRIRDMVCGALIASLVLCSGTVAFAKVANMNIPVSYNNIKVVVNGKQLSTSKEPFTYEGTTYLPIRAVAEAVGMDVNWDGQTKTVTLSSGGSTETQPVKKEEGTAVGKVLYNANGIKVTYKGISSEERLITGKSVNLLIENTSNRNLTVQVRDFSVNGYMSDPIFSSSVAAGKKAMDEISIMKSDLEKNGITDIEDIEFTFHVFDDDDWEYRFDSEIIKIKG